MTPSPTMPVTPVIMMRMGTHAYQAAMETTTMDDAGSRIERLLGPYLPGKHVSGSAEIDRTRRKWGTVYQDGQRVRHEPVEDWIDP